MYSLLGNALTGGPPPRPCSCRPRGGPCDGFIPAAAGPAAGADGGTGLRVGPCVSGPPPLQAVSQHRQPGLHAAVARGSPAVPTQASALLVSLGWKLTTTRCPVAPCTRSTNTYVLAAPGVAAAPVAAPMAAPMAAPVAAPVAAPAPKEPKPAPKVRSMHPPWRQHAAPSSSSCTPAARDAMQGRMRALSAAKHEGPAGSVASSHVCGPAGPPQPPACSS